MVELWLNGAGALAWARTFCSHRVATFFAMQGCVIQLVLAFGYVLASRTRSKELRRIRSSEAAGNSLAFLYPNINDLECSVQEKLPRVAVIMPIKGVGEHHLSNWRSQLLSLYGGELEFIFITESRSDPAFFVISQLLLDLKGEIDARVICAGLSTKCSQKIHNQLAGVDAMHRDTKYVLFLDDDVRLHPGTIGAVVAKMEEDSKIFVLTGYPFDLPTKRLGSYCIYEYHMPCSIGFAATGDRTVFLWGGFMMMHAEDFRCNLYGMVTGLRNGGYSDDMTLAAISDANRCHPYWTALSYIVYISAAIFAAANGRKISSPPAAVFFHPLARQLTFSQYWNYLRKQTIVLETYLSPVNYVMNRALFYVHCWLSWNVIFPTFAAVVHILVMIGSCLGSSSDLRPHFTTGCVIFCCAMLSKTIELLAIRHLSIVEINLCNTLSPEDSPISIDSFDWFFVFIATIVDNFMYPLSALTSTISQHINWSGVDYYFQNGRICKIQRPHKVDHQSGSFSSVQRR